MKSERQNRILELIKNEICLTQEDLQNGLKKMGYTVTQSTVSRDIRELKLIKSRDENGYYRYTYNPSSNNKREDNHYKELFQKSAISVCYSLNNVVVKCYNGMAQSACVAIDELYGEMMLGSLAGDDTVIIVTAGQSESERLTEHLLMLI